MAKKITSQNKIPQKAAHREAAQINPVNLNGWAVGLITAFAIFFLSLSGSMDSTLEKWTGLAAAVLLFALLLFTKRTSVLKNYVTPLFYSFFAYVLWGGVSTFYAASGKFAIFEFSKLLVALCVYMVVLFFTDSNQDGFKRISTIIASAGCFFGVISIDAASSGILSGIFKSIFGHFTNNFNANSMYEQGIRINGIFGNPNTFAGFMAIAVILSLYLTISASSKREARLSVSLLALNTLAFLLSFSMGALFFFLIACLVMIISSEKGKRVDLFLLMFETAVITFIFAFISMSGLGKKGFISLIPDLALILNAVILYFIDRILRPVFNQRLNANIKMLTGIVILIFVLVSGYLIAAFNVSGNLHLAANTSVMRAEYIPEGDYTLAVESSKPISVSVESQNKYDLMRHTSTVVYSGSNDKKINFTVPKDSDIVKIHFSSADDIDITNASYDGTENGKVHLKYPLLPEFVANRLQDIFANQNVVQRGIFFEDGMKLFSKSPVIGRGLGGFENGVYSVQEFFYETKYAHNHYIQVLCDLGIVGFILFVSMLLFSVISLIQSKKGSRAVYAIPVLAACVVQIFGQALTDAVWSTGVFLVFAAALLALITIFCSEPLKLKAAFNKERLKLAEKVVLAVFTGAFILLLTGNLYAQEHAKRGVENFDEIKRLIALDRFEYNDYKLSYIINATKTNSDKILAQADIYAAELSDVESNSLTPYIVAYKFQRYYDSDAFDIAKKGLIHNKSNPNMWIQLFNVFEQYIDPVGPNKDDAADRLKSPKYYVNSVLDIYNSLVQRNKSSLDDITLSPYNNAFVGKMLEIQATHLYSIDWVFTAIMTYPFDSVCAVDANQDGLPDSMSVQSGSAQGQKDGKLSVSDNTVLNFDLYYKLRGKYTFKVETDTPAGIKISYNGQDQNVTYGKNEVYMTVDLQNNTDLSISKFTVTFPSAAEIDAITFTTELNL